MTQTDVRVPFWRMDGISKHYGGVRALDECRTDGRARQDPCGARRERRRQVDADQDHERRGPARLPGPWRSRASRSASTSPADAMRSGVVCIFQELSLIPDLTVAENICAPEPPRRFGLIDRRAQRRRAEALACPRALRGRPPGRGRAQSSPLAPPDDRDRTGARTLAEAPDPGRGDLGADRGRRRADLRDPRPSSRRGAWRSSTSLIACARSRRLPTIVRSSATAGTWSPSPRAARAATRSSN